MGQQQLLLLVLSTVIVGLATVAGIQAFSENQQQATQDALVQRAISLGSDISAAAKQPTQMGGVKLKGNNEVSNIANSIGLSSGTNIPADGAGENARCKILAGSDGTAKVKCDDDAGGSGSYDNGQTITVKVNPSGTDPVKVSNIKVTS